MDGMDDIVISLPEVDIEHAKRLILSTLRLNAPEGVRVQVKPVLLLGMPGIGKTSAVYQVAEELRRTTGQEWPVLKFRLSEVLPEDFLGIPALVDGQTHWMPPATLPHRRNAALPERGILFFDEINRSHRMVLNAVMKVLDRDDLKPGWIIVAAGNLGDEDDTVVTELDAAQLRRFLILKTVFQLDVWLEWARREGIDPVILEFLERSSSSALMSYKTESGRRAFLTPAHWAELSEIKAANPNLDWLQLMELLAGAHLGPAYNPFLAFLKHQFTLDADAFFCLAGEGQIANECAERIQTADRLLLYDMIEDVLARLRANPKRRYLVKCLRKLLALDVLDIDAWVAFLKELMALTPKAVDDFLRAEPKLAEQLKEILLSVT